MVHMGTRSGIILIEGLCNTKVPVTDSIDIFKNTIVL